jgi:hypothetical protein
MSNKLTVDQDKRLREWIHKRQNGCPSCGGKELTVHTYVTLEVQAQPVKPVDLAGLAALMRGELLPCAALHCEGCGDVRLLSLVTAGVLGPGLQPVVNPLPIAAVRRLAAVPSPSAEAAPSAEGLPPVGP